MRKQNFEKLALAFQMGPHLNNLISSYSHGMKQKLALIAAFSHTPKLLILDEPFVGLDPEAFVILKEQMKELCASGNSVLFSSHILDVVEKVCNKVSVIKHGQLLYSGRTTEIVGTKGLEEVFMEMKGEKFLLPLLRNNLLQLSHANQLRYADTKNRTKTITLYMLIAAILMGLLAYLIYSLKIIYSIAWSLEEVVTELVIPMVLICVSLNIAISVFWGSGLLLSDTNIDSMLALPIPLRTLILSKLTVLFMVEVALTVALLLPMMVLFGLTADMGFPFYLIVLGITIIFPVIPGLLGTMIGTQIYRILKSSSARIARLKAAAAILVLFAFMIFMFCKFPDIAAGNFGDVISTSTFTLYADQYIHRLLNGDYLLIGLYFGGVFLIGVILL